LENTLKSNNKQYSDKKVFNKSFSTKLEGRTVEVKNNDIHYALRKLKKKVQEDGTLQLLKEREFYTKPSELKKRAKAAARARWVKKSKEK